MITETFEEASSAFTDFLRQQGQSSELLWVCREDITGRRRKLFVHPYPPASNRELYQHHFEFGIQQARGVRFHVLCFAADRACCYVWVPKDDTDASQAMLSDDHLHYSFSVEREDSSRGFLAQRASNSAAFLLRRAWYRLRGESPPIQEVPMRSDLETNFNTRNIQPT